MLLHAKSSKEPFRNSIACPRPSKQFEAYIAGFNEWAQASGLPQRVGFGVPGPFWRGDSGKAWTYRAWSTRVIGGMSNAQAFREPHRMGFGEPTPRVR